MKIKKDKLFRRLALAAFLLFPVVGYCAHDNVFEFDGSEAESQKLGQVKRKFNALGNMAYYTMYLAGGVMLGAGAFKLKQGDIPGFTKMAAGGGVLFAVPTVMTSLKDYSNS